jgi:hypothetical protein
VSSFQSGLVTCLPFGFGAEAVFLALTARLAGLSAAAGALAWDCDWGD